MSYSLKPTSVEVPIIYPNGSKDKVYHTFRRLTCAEELETMAAESAERKLDGDEWNQVHHERVCAEWDKLVIEVEGYEFGAQAGDWKNDIPVAHKAKAYYEFLLKKGRIERPDLLSSTNLNETGKATAPDETSVASPKALPDKMCVTSPGPDALTPAPSTPDESSGSSGSKT